MLQPHDVLLSGLYHRSLLRHDLLPSRISVLSERPYLLSSEHAVQPLWHGARMLHTAEWDMYAATRPGVLWGCAVLQWQVLPSRRDLLQWEVLPSRFNLQPGNGHLLYPGRSFLCWRLYLLQRRAVLPGSVLPCRHDLQRDRAVHAMRTVGRAMPSGGLAPVLRWRLRPERRRSGLPVSTDPTPPANAAPRG